MKTSTVAVRRYREEDEAAVLELLGASLGGGPAGRRPPEFFRWKHRTNAFGPSLMLVAEVNGRIAGLRAFMSWRFRTGRVDLRAVRAVDTATHPDFQRLGIFRSLTLEAIDILRADGDLIFNTPNAKSLPGYLKMGWRPVGKIAVAIRFRKNVVSAMRRERVPPAVEAASAADILRETHDLDDLASEAAFDGGRIETPRDRSYLQWRYGAAPLLDYRAVRLQDGGRTRGIAVFRVRRRRSLWETTVTELIVRPGDRNAARRLLSDVRRAAKVDHLACHFPRGSVPARAAVRAGFVRVPGGVTLVVNPLRDGLFPEPTRLDSWALSIGDLEVF